MWKEEIQIQGEYDFDYALRRLSMDPLLTVDLEERYVLVPVKTGKGKEVVKVQGIGMTQKPVFQIQGTGEKKKETLKKIKAFFKWDKPMEKIYEHFEHTNLKELFHKYPGTPIVKDFGYYESLMKIIVHQQLNMKFAYTLTSRFVQKFGEQMDGVWFYPSPETVASLRYEDLREIQFSQRKAEYIIDTSRLIVEGKLDLEELANQEDEEVIHELTKIRGIGHWTAENWLLFGVGRPNLLPAADIGIQNALKRFLGRDTKPQKDEIYVMGEEWQPYRSYAAIVLWRSIEEVTK